MKKTFLIFLLITLYSLLFTYYSTACIGARALSMGGAFIGLSDDASSTYWNQAALARIRKPIVTYMGTLTNRLELNYNDFVAVIIPIGHSTALAISHIFLDEPAGYYISIDVEGNPSVIDRVIYQNKFYFISYGLKIKKINTYIGFNLKEQRHTFYTANIGLKKNSYAYSYDISLFKELSKELSFGILIQDINRPKGLRRYIRNYRLGIAYKPQKEITITYDLYNIYPEEDKEFTTDEYRVGIEVWVSDEFAIRAGSYGDTFTTAGLGYKKDKLQIDYCIMHHRAVRQKLKDATHIASITKMF